MLNARAVDPMAVTLGRVTAQVDETHHDSKNGRRPMESAQRCVEIGTRILRPLRLLCRRDRREWTGLDIAALRAGTTNVTKCGQATHDEVVPLTPGRFQAPSKKVDR